MGTKNYQNFMAALRIELRPERLLDGHQPQRTVLPLHHATLDADLISDKLYKYK